MPIQGPTDGSTQNQYEEPKPKKTVHGVSPVDLKVVNYTDGKGNTETRLLIEFLGKKFFFPKGTDEAMQIPAPWICDQVDQVLGRAPNPAAAPQANEDAALDQDIPPIKVDPMGGASA